MTFKSITILSVVVVACLTAAAPQGEDPVIVTEDTTTAELAKDVMTTEHHFGGDLDALLEHYDQIDIKDRRRRATDTIGEKECTKDGVKGRCTAYYLCTDSSDSSAVDFGLIDSRVTIAEDKEVCPGSGVNVCCLAVNRVNN